MEDWPGGAATLSLADGMGGMRGRGVRRGAYGKKPTEAQRRGHDNSRAT